MSEQLDPQLGSGRLLAELDQLTGVGQSLEGLVRVEVDSGCVPTLLDIDPAAMRLAPADLSAGIIVALQTAAEDVRAQVAGRLRVSVDDLAPGVTVPDVQHEVRAAIEDAMTDFAGVRQRLLDALDGA